MNKQELNQIISKELSKVKKEVLILEELKKIDLSKFHEKQVSKRIETHLKKTLGENYYISVGNDSPYNFKVYISKNERPRDYNYTPTVEITIYNNHGIFNNDIFSSEVIKWIESKQKTINNLSDEINNIDDAIKLYNDLIDLEKKATEKLSYKFKDATEFYRLHYRYKIGA